MAKLKDLSVSFLSLVKTPATGKGLTLKSAKPGERAATFEIIKTDDELMRAYGVVYAPDQEDAHGDTADAATIRKAQAEFMREGRVQNIDTEHSFTAEMAFVAESWLVRKSDPLFSDEPEGAWAVGIQIGDPDLWKQLKSGELTGISLAGVARMEPEPDDPANPRYTEKTQDAPSWVERLIKALTGASQETIEETDEMDKQEVQDIVRATLKDELGSAIKDALKTAGVGTTAEPKPDATTDQEPSSEATPEETDISKAIAKGFKALEDKVDDKITKALAKGMTETNPAAGDIEESYV